MLPLIAARSISEDDAIGELAEVSRAQPEHRGQLRMILDYLALGALIERDGGMIRPGRLARDDGQAILRPEESTVTQLQPTTPSAPTRVNTMFSGGAAGGLNLSVNIEVDMEKMGTWPPQVVSAFMAGLAQVITAKAAAEASTTR